MKSLLQHNIGNKVYKECYSSMGASSTGEHVIKHMSYRFDQDTGARYATIWLEDDEGYDTRTGEAIGGSMYYIEPIKEAT